MIADEVAKIAGALAKWNALDADSAGLVRAATF